MPLRPCCASHALKHRLDNLSGMSRLLGHPVPKIERNPSGYGRTPCCIIRRRVAVPVMPVELSAEGYYNLRPESLSEFK